MQHRFLFAALSVAFALALSAGAFAQANDHSSMARTMTQAKATSASFTTSAAFKGQLDGVYTAYLALQASFSGDAFPSVGTNARALSTALGAVDMKLLTDSQTHMAWMAASDSLEKSVGQIANAKDIEAARAAFKPLSATLITTAKQFGTSGKTALYALHCPMAFNNQGADWIQANKTVKNPYFGKTMLACGKITETLSPGNGK
jgi:membrane fusion protein, copper/silver efflux system